ncbi:MAG: M14 family zinc carboxypeptidase [Candidatus Neomarinimicrobiota bacterium]
MKYIIYLFLILPLFGQSLDERYHSVDEIYAYLDSLNQIEELEDWVHLDTIGYSSAENIPILGLRISDNADEKEDEPRVLFIGQVHAEEILGIEIVLDMIEDLLFPDASIHTHMSILKQYLDIWLIPTANPEGLNVVHDELDFSYRKNKRDFSPQGPFPNGQFDYDPSIGNDIDGVDLNRNFEFNWVFGDTFLEPDNSDYASHYDYYKGEEPFSENEAIAIRDLALENDFVFSIVWHSSRSGNLSEKVFTSWKWEEVKESPDLEIMKSIADQFSASIETEDGTSTYLSVFSGSRNGKIHDWFYRETGSFQYLVECGTSNLQPDSVLIENTISRTKPAMIYLMDRAIGYYADAAQVTGIIYDAQTSHPIQGAVVEVIEHSGSVLKPRKTNEFGRFRRILDVGTYTFIFKADGYVPQVIPLVTNNSGITENNIYLEPAPSYEINIRLVHEEEDYRTINGIISNEFSSNEIEISSGDNIFEMSGGQYDLQFLMSDGFVPWEKTIVLNSNFEISIPHLQVSVNNLTSLLPWQNSIGTWTMQDMILRTQEGFLYNNMDSTFEEISMDSDLLNVSGSNRIVVALDHRYETEWDYDQVSLSIMNEDNIILGSKSWSGDNWEDFQTELVTANSDSVFSSVKVRLKFTPDQTVNYRGWEVRSINLFSISDEYLESFGLKSNTIPKIPMRIKGIYPNPSYGKLQLDIENFPGGNANIQIFNILGQNVLSKNYKNIISGRHFMSLDLSHMNGMITGSGMFFIRIQTKTEQAVKKCIILKN